MFKVRAVKLTSDVSEFRGVSITNMKGKTLVELLLKNRLRQPDVLPDVLTHFE